MDLGLTTLCFVGTQPPSKLIPRVLKINEEHLSGIHSVASVSSMLRPFFAINGSGCPPINNWLTVSCWNLVLSALLVFKPPFSVDCAMVFPLQAWAWGIFSQRYWDGSIIQGLMCELQQVPCSTHSVFHGSRLQLHGGNGLKFLHVGGKKLSISMLWSYVLLS